MATLVLSSASGGDLGIRGGQIVVHSDGTPYAVFFNTSSESLVIYECTTPTLLETVTDTTIFGDSNGVTLEADAAIDSNDKIHVVCGYRDGSGGNGTNGDVMYRVYDIDTDTWDGSGWEAVYTASDPANNAPVMNIRIAIDSSDYPWVTFQDRVAYHGGAYIQVYISDRSNGSSWSTATRLTDTDNSQYRNYAIEFAPNGDIVFAYVDLTGATCGTKRYTTSWGSAVELAYTISGLYQYQRCKMINEPGTSTNKMRVPHLVDQTNNDIRYFLDGATTYTDTGKNMYITGSGTDWSQWHHTSNDDAYMLWPEESNGDISSAIDTGSGYGSSTQEQDSGANNNYVIRSFWQQYNNNDASVCHYIFDGYVSGTLGLYYDTIGGGTSASANTDAYLIGGINSLDTQPVYLESVGIDTNSSTSAYLHTWEASSIPAYLTGPHPASSSTKAFITVVNPASSTQSAYMTADDGIFVAVATWTANTSSGNQDITSPDLAGHTPKHVQLFMINRTSFNTQTEYTEPWVSRGYGESGNSNVHSNNTEITSGGTAIRVADTHIFRDYNDDTFKATLNSFITNGVRITWDGTYYPSSEWIGLAVFFAGDDLSVYGETIGQVGGTTITTTAPGFEPDLVLGLYYHEGGSGTPYSVGVGAGWKFGGFSINTSPIQHGTVWVQLQTNDDSSVRDTYTWVEDGNATGRFAITSFNSDGLTITPSPNPDPIYGTSLQYHCLSLSNKLQYLDTYQSRTTTGLQKITTGFQPEFIHIDQGTATSLNTWQTSGMRNSASWGYFSNNQQHAVAASVHDTDITEATAGIHEDVVIALYNYTAGSLYIGASVVKIDTDGFWIDYTTVDSTAHYGIIYALGSDAGDRTTQPAYMNGTAEIDTDDSATVYLHGSIDVSDTTDAFLDADADDLTTVSAWLDGHFESQYSGSLWVFLRGSINALDTQSAYATGGVESSDSRSSYLHGTSDAVSTQSAYTFNAVDDLDTQLAYLHGSSNTTSSTPALIVSDLESVSSSVSTYMICNVYEGELTVPVFIDAVGISDDTQGAFIPGGIAESSSTPAFCQSGEYTASGSQRAFLASVITSSTDAYLSGTVTVLQYGVVELDDGTRYKFRVLADQYASLIVERLTQPDRTAGGGIDAATGENYKRFEPVIKAKHTDTEYATISDLESLYALHETFTWYDHLGGNHRVKMLGNFNKGVLAVNIEGDNAWFTVKITLLTIKE